MEHPENETKASTTEDLILTVTLLSFQQCIPEFQTACYAGVTTHRSEHPVYPECPEVPLLDQGDCLTRASDKSI